MKFWLGLHALGIGIGFKLVFQGENGAFIADALPHFPQSHKICFRGLEQSHVCNCLPTQPTIHIFGQGQDGWTSPGMIMLLSLDCTLDWEICVSARKLLYRPLMLMLGSLRSPAPCGLSASIQTEQKPETLPPYLVTLWALPYWQKKLVHGEKHLCDFAYK